MSDNCHSELAPADLAAENCHLCHTGYAIDEWVTLPGEGRTFYTLREYEGMLDRALMAVWTHFDHNWRMDTFYFTLHFEFRFRVKGTCHDFADYLEMDSRLWRAAFTRKIRDWVFNTYDDSYGEWLDSLETYQLLNMPMRMVTFKFSRSNFRFPAPWEIAHC
jgi:hypothetical protein